MPTRALFASILLASLALAPRTFADTSPQDRAAADALYEEAGKLAHQQRWHEAAAKLQASFKLDPAIGTLMQLAWVYEKEGRTASAWSTYQDAEALADKTADKRAKQAAQEAKRLESTLSRMLLDVPPEDRAAGIEIKRDGTTISADAWGSAVPVDPGVHDLEAKGPGKLPWKTTITIEAKPGTTTVPVPVLQNGPTTPDTPARTAPVLVPFWGPQRIAGTAIGAVGLVGLGIGSAFTALMVNKNHESTAYCPVTQTQCLQPGIDLRNQAFDAAHIATGTFIAGAAVLAGGIIVFLAAPSSAPKPMPATARATVQPIAGPGLAGAALQGAW